MSKIEKIYGSQIDKISKIGRVDKSNLHGIMGIEIPELIDNYTKLLLHMNLDKSNNTNSITSVNKVVFNNTIKKLGNFSVEFNSSNNSHLTIPDSSDWDFGTNDFTIETYVYLKNVNNYQRLLGGGAINDGAYNMWFLGIGNDSGANHVGLNFGYYNGTNYNEIYTGDSFSNNVWYHVAVSRHGSNMYFFINGVKVYTWTISITDAINTGSAGLIIGARYYTNQSNIVEYLNGYLDELRISKGVARWTSDFTPPTGSYLSDTYTSLLLNFEEESSNYHHQITSDNSNKFDVSTKKFGKSSLYFNGASYLHLPDSSDWDFGTNDFTIETYVYLKNVNNYQRLLGGGAINDGAYNMWFLGIGNDSGANHVGLNFGYYNGTNYNEIYTGDSFSNNVWYHVAVSRHGSNMYFFINGTKVYTWVISITDAINTGSSGLIIGARYVNNQSEITEYLNGNLDELRISKGVARWTSDFTPPTVEY